MDPQDGVAPLADVVVAAQAGDRAAWAELVRRFQDVAVAVAVGCSPEWGTAPDIAQEAFELAFRHLSQLSEPAAFPGWFRQLVRTAASRRGRRRRLREESLESSRAQLPSETKDPSAEVIADDEAARVRAGIEALPEPERTVVALHYLGDLSYPDVAAFLGIAVSAVKKRAWCARQRLKESLPMTAHVLAAARPSRSGTFRDRILLFRAIRDGDVGSARVLLARDPSLARAHEDWEPEEGMASGLGFSARGSALIRAAQTGNVEMCRLLVEMGAAIDGECGCETRETPLWAATVSEEAAVVDYLLGAGARTDLANNVGATPLHVAVQRHNIDMAAALLAAGADPGRTDVHGRTPGDWALLRRVRPASGSGEYLHTELRAIDLFAPLRRGGLYHWPPGYGLGQAVALFGIADALRPASFWLLGFAHGPYDPTGFANEAKETGVPVNLRLVGGDDPHDRRRAFASVLDEMARSAGNKVVACLQGPGHRHDVTLALPSLVEDPSVLATVVIEPWSGVTGPEAPLGVPEGFDGRVVFDRRRARRGLWPAVDPVRTTGTWWPDERHRRLADRARQLLRQYDRVDPTLDLPEPSTPAEAAAQELIRWLAHPFRVTEPFTAEPAARTTQEELLDRAEQLTGPQ